MNYLFTRKQKLKRKKREKCPTRYILDLNRRNVKVKITIKKKS